MRAALRTILGVFLVTGILVAPHAARAVDIGIACTQEQDLAVRAEMGSLTTWSALYDSFKRYWQCDRKAVSEAYSTIVAGLLTYDWEQFSELNTLASRDQQFAQFVVHHVDCRWSQEQISRTLENASSHCPKGDKDLCQSITDRLQTPECD